jgi:hypothetical protein
MCDVLIVVIGFDGFQAESRILICKAAIPADDELEVARFPRQVILGNDEVAA